MYITTVFYKNYTNKEKWHHKLMPYPYIHSYIDITVDSSTSDTSSVNRKMNIIGNFCNTNPACRIGKCDQINIG